MTHSLEAFPLDTTAEEQAAGFWRIAGNRKLKAETLDLRDRIAPDAALDLAKWSTWDTRETITQAVDRIWNEFLPARRTYMFKSMLQGSGGEILKAQAPDVLVSLQEFECRPTGGNPLQE